MLPPPGWEILKNSHGSTLLFKGPKTMGDISYQPTIQVMVFQEYRYIDDMTVQEYGNLIVDKFSKLSNQVIDYRLRSSEKVKLETGDDSILYYTEFNYGSVPIMQMHILVSSATHHFLMTYTDLAHVFESDNSPGLITAYSSMHSAVLSSRPPSRFDGIMIGGGAVVAFIILWFGFRFIRSYQLSRLGERMEEEDSQEIKSDEETEYYSRQTLLSEAAPVDDEDDDEPAVKSKVKQKASKAVKPQIREDEEEESSLPVPHTHARDELPPPAPTVSPVKVSSLPPAVPPAPLLETPRVTVAPMPSPYAEASQPSVPAPAPAPLRKPAPALDIDMDAATQHSEVAQLSDILPQDGTEDGKPGKKKRGFLWGRKKAQDNDDDEPSSEAWAGETEKLDAAGEAAEAKPEKEALKGLSKRKRKGKNDDDDELDAPLSEAWAIDEAPSKSSLAEESGSMGSDDAEAKNKSSAAKPAKAKKGKAKPALSEAVESDEPETDAWNLAGSHESLAAADDEEEVG